MSKQGLPCFVAAPVAQSSGPAAKDGLDGTDMSPINWINY
jgi:hypothetical protein